MAQQGPLRVQVICPDAGLREQLVQAFEALGAETAWCQALAKYPSGTELARALRTFSPQAIFLSLENLETAVAVVRYLESEAEALPVVAVHAGLDQDRMMQALHVGARDFLTPPFEPEQLASSLEAVRRLLKTAPLSYSATDHIYSFLPAKPGVGTTTVAVHASAAFAQESA